MKRYAALLPVLVLLLLAAGCGSAAIERDAAPAPTDGLDPVARAAAATAEVGSSRVEYTVDVTAARQSFEMTGEGVFDYREPRGVVTFRMDIPELGPFSMEMRMVGMTMYMRMPAVALAEMSLPAGKEWLSFDLKATLEAAGLGALDLSQQQQDPGQTLQYLRAASDDVREGGPEVVRGVETTRYVGNMNLRKALDVGLDRLQLPQAEREQARAGIEKLLEQSGSESIPFEVFVDREGLLRRMTMHMTMVVGGEEATMSMEMDYFDFGVDVNVEAPPAAAVVDMTAAVARAAQG